MAILCFAEQCWVLFYWQGWKKSFSSSVSLMKQFKTFSHDNNLVLILKIRFWIQISHYHIIFKIRVCSVACLLYNLPFLLCHLTLQKAMSLDNLCALFFSQNLQDLRRPIHWMSTISIHIDTGFSWQICGGNLLHNSTEWVPTWCCFIQLFTTQKFPFINHHDLKKLSKLLGYCQCQPTHLLARHRVFHYVGFQVSRV